MKATVMPVHPHKAAELLRELASKFESTPPKQSLIRPEAHPDRLISSLTDLTNRLAQSCEKPFVSTFDWPFQVESVAHLLDKANEANSRNCEFAFDVLLVAASELTLDVIRCVAHDCGLDPCHYDSNEKSLQKLEVIK